MPESEPRPLQRLDDIAVHDTVVLRCGSYRCVAINGDAVHLDGPHKHTWVSRSKPWVQGMPDYDVLAIKRSW